MWVADSTAAGMAVGDHVGYRGCSVMLGQATVRNQHGQYPCSPWPLHRTTHHLPCGRTTGSALPRDLADVSPCSLQGGVTTGESALCPSVNELGRSAAIRSATSFAASGPYCASTRCMAEGSVLLSAAGAVISVRRHSRAVHSMSSGMTGIPGGMGEETIGHQGTGTTR
jgi:hypothetical protein